MGYEKLTVEHFALNLKEGKYAGLTGARRAIGKTGGWGEAERKRAHVLADKHFGAPEAAMSQKGKTAKKTAQPAKKATKPAAAPKTPKVKTAKPAKRAVKALRQKAATFTEYSDADFPTFTAGRLMQQDDPATVRQHSASTVIAAYRNAGPLNPREQRAYDIATAEYAAGASDVALRAVDGGEGTAPPKKPVGATKALATAPVAPPSAPLVTVPAITTDVSPRIPVASEPNTVTLADLSPEELRQHERLLKSANALGVPAPTA